MHTEPTWWEKLGLTAEEGKALEEAAVSRWIAGVPCDPRDAALALLGQDMREFVARCHAVEIALFEKESR